MATNSVLEKGKAEQEHHQALLHGYYQAWVSLERAAFPPPILRCYISSIRLALTTLHTIEADLKILLELAEDKLREIEQADAGLEHFTRHVRGRRS